MPNKTSSAGNNTIAILKTLRAMTPGRNISVTEPLSAPYFSAREVRGHRHLLRINTIPSMKMAAIAMSKTQLKVFVTPAYRMYSRHADIKKNISV
jgi:hypothetical protein